MLTPLKTVTMPLSSGRRFFPCIHKQQQFVCAHILNSISQRSFICPFLGWVPLYHHSALCKHLSSSLHLRMRPYVCPLRCPTSLVQLNRMFLFFAALRTSAQPTFTMFFGRPSSAHSKDFNLQNQVPHASKVGFEAHVRHIMPHAQNAAGRSPRMSTSVQGILQKD
jgi:hypothetical protein